MSERAICDQVIEGLRSGTLDSWMKSHLKECEACSADWRMWQHQGEHPTLAEETRQQFLVAKAMRP